MGREAVIFDSEVLGDVRAFATLAASPLMPEFGYTEVQSDSMAPTPQPRDVEHLFHATRTALQSNQPFPSVWPTEKCSSVLMGFFFLLPPQLPAHPPHSFYISHPLSAGVTPSSSCEGCDSAVVAWGVTVVGRRAL